MSQPVESIPTYVLTPNALEPTEYCVSSLADAVAYEPDGVYTVARTFLGDHAVLLDAHLDRLEESAQLVGISLELDRERLRAALRDLLHRADYPNAKFRITVPRAHPEYLYLALEPYRAVSEAIMQAGAYVITLPAMRGNPDAKTTDWMTERRAAYESLPPGVYEGVMVSDDGRLLEGLSSNIYGVLDGVLHTAGDGVLAGITRRAMYEIAPEVLPVERVPLHLDDLPHVSEAMLTSSSRGIVPITRVNDQLVGDGLVGRVVQQLQELYDSWTAAHAKPI